MQTFWEIFQRVFYVFAIGLSTIGGVVGILFLFLVIAACLEKTLEKFISNELIIRIIIGLVIIILMTLLGTTIIYTLQLIGLTKK
ncbi:hypothetical protein G6Z25_02270 [Clostridium perfringens]|uniref:hypothetical protein n=1 Tax=Clostridium perfringens TaxID=1502 RepID=UPI0013E402C5|nr:hypothetical protein [Clostridium perfringens]NGS95745.1 hypothetical protein [Clostridium perfringens]